MKKRFWHILDAVAFYLIYIFSGLFARLILSVFHSVRLAFEYGANHMVLDINLFFEQVIYAVEERPILIVLIANMAVILFAMLVLRLRGQYVLEYTALRPCGILNIVGAMISGILLHLAVSMFMARFVTNTQLMQNYESSIARLMDADAVLVVLVVVIIAPLVEEIMFRGVLFRAIGNGVNVLTAAIVTSMLFSVAHGDPVQMSYAFVLGMILATVRARSGSLWPCVMLHMAFNSANFLYVQQRAVTVSPILLTMLLVASFFMATRFRKTEVLSQEKRLQRQNIHKPY